MIADEGDMLTFTGRRAGVGEGVEDKEEVEDDDRGRVLAVLAAVGVIVADTD